MASRCLLVLGLALGTAAGCAADGVDGPIDYALTGEIVNEALHIELDGSMTLRSDGGAARTAQLDDARLDDLREKIERAGFSGLESNYGNGGAADDLVHSVSVRLDGQPYVVVAEEHVAKPQRLEIVIDTLRDIAETSFR